MYGLAVVAVTEILHHWLAGELYLYSPQEHRIVVFIMATRHRCEARQFDESTKSNVRRFQYTDIGQMYASLEGCLNRRTDRKSLQQEFAER